MPEDKDYKEVLSGTVEDAKEKIRNLDSPDYRKLLRLEREGEDRSSLKDFLKGKIDSLKGEDEAEDEETEETEDTEASEDEVTEEYGQSGFVDKLSSLSFKELLLLGGVAGLVLGLLVGYSLGPDATAQGQPNEAQSAVQELIAAGDFNGTTDVGSPVRQHGMYYFNVSMTQETPNGTQTGYQAVYVTEDAELLFPVMNNMFVQSPINIQEALAQQRQSQQQQQAPAQ